MIQLGVLLAALAAAGAAGLLWRRRSGQARESVTAGPSAAVAALTDKPAVIHFSAPWCRPCDAVRRVVAQVVTDLSTTAQPPADIELDIDEHASLAKELGVLSLPSTFVFDGQAQQRFRISGVPTADGLRSALAPLTV